MATVIYNTMQICREGALEAGTLGGFFTFGGKDVFAISNNHVIANLNNCSVGDAIFQAGSDVQIGTLQYWIKLNNQKNYLDIALFKLLPDIEPCWKLPGKIIYPPSIEQGVEEQIVYIIKNNGSIRKGKVSTLFIDEEIIFTHSGRNFPFTGLTEVDPLEGRPFSIPGESGSLIYDEDYNVLGVLIGANQDKSKSYYVPFIHDNLGIDAKYELEIWRKKRK
ncbi:hypothetical protein [uncultured Flavobacterium sp.]|uniref:hypothetical protein n=1 Tax=uncultured Flavobacterium sp. TaxID=165435 RepID=UPI00308121C4